MPKMPASELNGCKAAIQLSLKTQHKNVIPSSTWYPYRPSFIFLANWNRTTG